jgi:hypothetical protein
MDEALAIFLIHSYKPLQAFLFKLIKGDIMKNCFFIVLGTFLSLSAMATTEDVVGNYRVECTTSYPKTGAGLQAMTLGLIESQIKAGYSQIISTSATKVGWTDVSGDVGQAAVCVTAKK